MHCVIEPWLVGWFIKLNRIGWFLCGGSPSEKSYLQHFNRKKIATNKYKYKYYHKYLYTCISRLISICIWVNSNAQPHLENTRCWSNMCISSCICKTIILAFAKQWYLHLQNKKKGWQAHLETTGCQSSVFMSIHICKTIIFVFALRSYLYLQNYNICQTRKDDRLTLTPHAAKAGAKGRLTCQYLLLETNDHTNANTNTNTERNTIQIQTEIPAQILKKCY